MPFVAHSRARSYAFRCRPESRSRRLVACVPRLRAARLRKHEKRIYGVLAPSSTCKAVEAKFIGGTRRFSIAGFASGVPEGHRQGRPVDGGAGGRAGETHRAG